MTMDEYDEDTQLVPEEKLAVSCTSESNGSVSDDEAYVPFLERLTPKQRKKFDREMKRLRKRFKKKCAENRRKKQNTRI